ncbi:protein root primordium defective 1 [Tanacetum coccineum]
MEPKSSSASSQGGDVLCYICGKNGHKAKECCGFGCYKCGKVGHIGRARSRCNGDANGDMEGFVGHYSAICYYCGKGGYIADCSKCGETGHMDSEILSLVNEKRPDLEAALTRTCRWVVYNQIKNIILQCPHQVASVIFLQKKFKSFDPKGKALNWLEKYPCCFETCLENDEYFFRLTKQMMYSVDEEEYVKDMQEPVVVERLSKFLMMVSNHRLNVSKLNEVGRSVELPDDYLIRIILTVEEKARWKSSSLNPGRLVDGSRDLEKRAIGLLHEFLSLTLWKNASIMKLGHFMKEFGLPGNLHVMLLKHPGIFCEGMNAMKEAKKDPIHELSDDEEARGDDLGGIFDPEERNTFIKCFGRMVNGSFKWEGSRVFRLSQPLKVE